MLSIEALGWLAAGLTAATFACTDMRRLRLLALAANLAFIAYGAGAGLAPVLALHLALAPLNLWRLVQLQRRAMQVRARPHRRRPARADAPALAPRPTRRRVEAPRTGRRPALAARPRLPLWRDGSRAAASRP